MLPPCPPAALLPCATDHDHFGKLLEAVRLHCPDASRRLHEQYHQPLHRYIGHAFLPPESPLKREIDPADLAQKTWCSVYAQIRAGKTFASRADFRRFLFSVARNDFRKYHRYRVKAAKRSLKQEQSLGVAGDPPAARTADPAVQAAAADEWRRFVSGADESVRGLLLGMQNGETLPEVAARLGIHLRGAQRRVKRAREEWLRTHPE